MMQNWCGQLMNVGRHTSLSKTCPRLYATALTAIETVRQIMQPYISAVHSHNQEQSVEEVSKQAFRRHSSIYCKLLNGHSSGNRNVIHVHVIFNIQGCRKSSTQRLQLHVNNKRDNYNERYAKITLKLIKITLKLLQYLYFSVSDGLAS